MFRTHVSHVSRYQERPWHVQCQETSQLSTTTKSPNDINPSQGAVMTAFPSRKRKRTSRSNSSIWWHKCKTALSPRTEPESRLPTLQPESWTYMTNTHTHKEQEMESEQLTIPDSSCTKKAARKEIGFPKLHTSNNRPRSTATPNGVLVLLLLSTGRQKDRSQSSCDEEEIPAYKRTGRNLKYQQKGHSGDRRETSKRQRKKDKAAKRWHKRKRGFAKPASFCTRKATSPLRKEESNCRLLENTGGSRVIR